MDEDILWEIPDDDLPRLLAMYEKHKDLIPHVYSTVLTGITWRKKTKERYNIFLSPNGCWKEDGTFFVFMKEPEMDLFLFSLDDSGKNIYEGIRKTRRFGIEDSKEILLYATHHKFYPIAAKAFTDKGATLDVENRTYMFSIPKDDALKFNIECPKDVYIKKLDTSYASEINSVWPHQYTNSEKYISILIEMNDAFGVFLKSTDELVSWVLLSMMGQLTALQTKEEHKGKGYATLITKYMAKRLAEKGYNALGTVVEDNHSSVKMFEKMGFKSLGFAIYNHTS